MVLMMKKLKAAKKPAEPAAPAEAKPAAEEAKPAEPAAPAEPAEAPAPAEGEASAPAAEAPAPAVVEEEAPAEAVEALKAMGFDESQVRVALRLARNNTEIAAALLMEPEMMLQAQQAQDAANAGGMGGIPANPLAGGIPGNPLAAGGAGGGQLTEDQVVQMMEANPDMFRGMLEAITQQEPRIAALAQQNPQALISLLTQVLNQSVAQQGSGAPGAGMPAGMPGMPGAGQAPGAMDVPVTTEEREALEGLQAMFPHIPPLAILQTFKACGSDASMAANLLFDYDGETLAGA